MSPPLVDRQVVVAADELPSQADLECWVAAVLARHPGETRHELTVRLVEADESRTLNRDYRGRDRPTNVLSFPFESPPGLKMPLLGDLVICHAVVQQEAAAQDKALHHHYAHMVVHGTLHLLGHDHLEDEEADAMEGLERDILAALGVADPYRADTRDGHGAERHDTEDERPDE